MKIQTMVKITDSKDDTKLYDLFCRAAKGEYVNELKNDKGYAVHLEVTVGKAFDEFAQAMFDEGVKHQRSI